METPSRTGITMTIDYSSLVDSSRPFRSVKEAVAIFGERILVGEIYSPKSRDGNFTYYTPIPSPTSSVRTNHEIGDRTPSWNRTISPANANTNDDSFLNNVGPSLKKLEAELEETKVELKLLKERESETVIALASLNAELHKNMSRMAHAEAEAEAAAASAAAKKDSVALIRNHDQEKNKDRFRYSPSSALSQILSMGDYGGIMNEKRKKTSVMKKKKPVVPLLGDFFFRKKRASTTTTTYYPESM